MTAIPPNGPTGLPRDLLKNPDFPLQVKGRPTWQPDYKDVADNIVAFTRNYLGVEFREFTDDTAITAEEVARFIYDATDEVALYVGLVPDKAAGFAKATAAIGAAASAVRDKDLELAAALTEEYQRRLKSLYDGIGLDRRRGPDGALPSMNRPPARHTFPRPYDNGGLVY